MPGKQPALGLAAAPASSSNHGGLYQEQMRIWDTDDSSSAKSQGSNQGAESEDENVSDDNVDEDELSESHLVYAAAMNTHLENGAGFRLKNSFQ